MGKFRSRIGWFAALSMAAVVLMQAALAGTVQRARVVESGGRTRATIEVSGDPRIGVFTLAHPDRLVLDLHDCRFANDFGVPGPDGVIVNVRTGQPVPGDARLVFDLTAPASAQTRIDRHGDASTVTIEWSGVTQRAPVGQADATAANAIAPASATALRAASKPSTVDDDDATAATRKAPAQVANAVRPASSDARPDASASASPRDDGIASAGSAAPAATTSVPAEAVASMPHTVLPDRPRGARTLRDVLGAGQRKLVIAIDAGHGGQDVGAKGYAGSYEKNVTLAIARDLARQVDAEPGMRAVLTRDGDYFIPLAERYRKARAAKADLFISIHADADPTHTASGSSVWVLSQRGVTSQAARWLADRENAADLVGGVKLSDKDDTLASVLLDLSQSATMKASEDAAERVHQALRDIGRTHKAHPEHANFVVLRSPDVPSMLVETAFITNPEEERELNDPDYRARLAGAVLSGVRSYFIDNPLPGTQFAALHARDTHDARAVANVDHDTPVTAEPESSADDPEPAVESAAKPAVASPPSPRLASIGKTRLHIVHRGERLSDIAEDFGVTVAQLRALNGLESDRIRPGQRLRIPERDGQG